MIRLGSLAAIAATALLLSGCATIKPATDRETVEKAAASLPELPQAWTSARERVGDVKVGWIEAYNDPVLTKLVEEAQLNNRNLRAAAANVERSWALARQAGSPLLPSVDASGTVQNIERLESQNLGGLPIDIGSIPGFERYNVAVQASWEVDVWGRIRAGQQSAVESARSVEADYVFAQYSIASAVAQAYFLALEADQQIVVAQGIVDALTEISRVVNARYRYGMASAFDVSLAESDLATAQESLERAKNSRLIAVRSLEALLGRYPAAAIQTSGSFPALPAPPGAGVPSELLERRPDIIAAERQIAAAINSRKVAQAAKLPRFSLTTALNGASNDLEDVLDPANMLWTLAGNILAPIFDGGARDAAVDLADADTQAAVALYADTAINAFSEVEQALDLGVALRKQRAALERANQETDNAYRLSVLRYKEGEIDLIDVLSVQQRVFAAQSNLISIRRAQLNQYLDISLALGGDWRQPQPATQAP
ncbi:TolC family protein [Alterisphingorhabdus coralli]|uniref:TolC family protein n=1 Tax=Alterisphingorhabdus coralli TaxID=3071408 RepID=A0AA97F6Y7_9SPHN|nr:TolC family protein [Parasphingorhabdus sp. SCSIO 66989]WOE75341.1 TolC family protein [Parasphingorhabdus sp. SCSIO 66989]